MFKLNIFKKNDYNSLEKKCFSCKELYTKSALVKDDFFFNGNKYVCENCKEIFDLLVFQYIKKYQKMSSSDKLFLSANLNSYVKKFKNIEKEDYK